MVKICKKCGYATWNTNETICPICNTTTYSVGFFFGKKLSNTDLHGRRKLIENKYNIVIQEDLHQYKCKYLQHQYNSWKQQKKQQSEEFADENYKSFLEQRKNAPKCPTCGSINISNIGAGERVVSTTVWGIASNKIGKTKKCNNCGYTW